MKGLFQVQFLGKQEPNRAKGKTNYHYAGVVVDRPIVNNLADEFQVIDFWSEEDLLVEAAKLYPCVLNVQGDFIQFVELKI